MSELSAASAAHFCNHPLWADANWVATTFQVHPTGEAPPVMGIVFADWAKGVELFRSWVDDWGNGDERDDIRVVIVEGEIATQLPGYTVRIATQDTNDGKGQWQRMHPLPGTTDLLHPFKAEYLKHGEFMLAPVDRHDDNLPYVNAYAGIVKRQLLFRGVEDIVLGDMDECLIHASSSSFSGKTVEAMSADDTRQLIEDTLSGARQRTNEHALGSNAAGFELMEKSEFLLPEIESRLLELVSSGRSTDVEWRESVGLKDVLVAYLVGTIRGKRAESFAFLRKLPAAWLGCVLGVISTFFLRAPFAANTEPGKSLLDFLQWATEHCDQAVASVAGDVLEDLRSQLEVQ